MIADYRAGKTTADAESIKAIEARVAEYEAVEAGAKPTIPPWASQADVAAMLAGDGDAASSVCVAMQDFQRLPMAVHLFKEGLPVDVWGAFLLDGLMQTHYFRFIDSLDLATLVDQYKREQPPALPEGTPDEVTIWRGGYEHSISWTLSRDIAERFAEDAGDKSAIHQMTVSKSQVAIFTDERNEREVILHSGWWPDEFF